MRAVLAALAVIAAPPLAAAGERELGVDCVFCGPGQAIPHHCPRLQGGAPPPPNPLPARIDEAVRVRLRLLAAGGLDLPELGEPGDLERLNAVLGDLLSRVEASIDALRKESGTFLDREVAEVNEGVRLHNLAIDLQGRLTRLTRELERGAKDLGACGREASRLDEELLRIGKSRAGIRAESRATRVRLFRRLQEAEERGWILPPSAYRALPSPLSVPAPSLPPGDAPRGARPALAGAVAQAIVPDSGGARPGPAGSGGGEASVEERLRRLGALEAPLRNARAHRDHLHRAVETWQAEREKEAAKVSLLQSQRIRLEEDVATGRRKLAEARERVSGLGSRLSGERVQALYELVAWGIGRELDRKLEKRMEDAYGAGVDAAALLKLRDVAIAAAQLGSDTLAVVERFPKAMAEDGESLEALQRELDGAKHRFGLSLIGTYTDIPGPLLPYLMKER